MLSKRDTDGISGQCIKRRKPGKVYYDMEKRCTAILLAAGSGSRMKSRVAKQFLLLDGKPLIWYALRAVENSAVIDDCILVTAQEDIPYMRREIVERYGFRKVEAVVAGGEERCFSVANALRQMESGVLRVANRDGYVFIHDGARPFLTEKILRDTYAAVKEYHACVAAVPSKDTVKLADAEGFAASTPDRNLVWSIQTPQVFDTELITEAYGRLLREWEELHRGARVTDDAGVVELFSDIRVKLVQASYANIKITTPEDLLMAESLMKYTLKAAENQA